MDILHIHIKWRPVLSSSESVAARQVEGPHLVSYPRLITLVMVDGRWGAAEHGIPLWRRRSRRTRRRRRGIVVPRLGWEALLLRRRGLVELGPGASAGRSDV